ncbi:MAG TPA: ABC transporter substrate-binding protein [Thermodesulfobacteriota bacterium]
MSSQRLYRRTARRVLLLVAALALAAVPARPDEATAAPAPKPGGTLIMVIGADPPTLNPAITTGTPDLYTACKIFEGLVRLDRDLEPQPVLAESWTVQPDGLTYTFALRKGVTWHDGKPFTSKDVEWTFENVTAKFGPRTKGPFQAVKAVTTPDDHTVVLEMKEAYGPLLSLLTCSSAAILPAHVYSNGDILSHPRNLDPVGTGPFRFKSWARGDHIRLERNPTYWQRGQGMPYLDEIVMKIITDPKAAALALEAGEVDYIPDYFVDKAEYLRLKDHEGIVGQQDTNVPTNNVLIFNVRKAPLDRAEVRRAIFHAIDRAFIVEKAQFGLGGPGKSAIDSRLGWAYDRAVDFNRLYPYDPAKANALLDKAGLRRNAQGVRFEVTLPYESGKADFNEEAQIIRENLKAVGIAVDLMSLERSLMLDKVFKQWDFDLTLQRYTTSGDVAVGVQRLYVTSAIDRRPFTNPSGYSNPEVDALFEKGAKSPSPRTRAPHYHKVQEILARDVPVIVLTENPSVDLASTKFGGLWKGPDPYDWWEHVYQK